MDCQLQESILQFSWDLISFAYIRGQILLIEPLPPMKQSFSLNAYHQWLFHWLQEDPYHQWLFHWLQEEQHRGLIVSNKIESIATFNNYSALASQGNYNKPYLKKDRPTCKQCGMLLMFYT